MNEDKSNMDDDMLRGSEEDIPEVEHCDLCEEIGQSSRAETYCSDCSEKLCAVCTKRHAAAKPTRHHTPISIEDIKTDHNEYKCSMCIAIEKSSQANVFCDDCDDFLCTECAKIHSVQRCTQTHIPITIEAYKARNKILCDLCAEKNAENWCKECTQTLCKDCSTRHRKQRVTKDHILVPASEMPSLETRECSPCSLLKMKTVAEKCCPECKEFLCASCVSLHKTRKATQTHDLIDNSEYSATKENVICDVCQLVGKVIEAKYACLKCEDRLCDGCTNLHKKQKATRNHIIVAVCDLEQTLARKCDICDGQDNEAVSFCESCDEHLCERCTNAHKTRKATATHVLQDPRQSDTNELCEPCFEGNEKIIAKSFCIICEERLCVNCSKYHRIQKSTKDHAIRSINEKQYKPNTFVCGICPPGNGQGVAINFCDTCGENICAVCLKQHTRQKATKFHTISASPKIQNRCEEDMSTNAEYPSTDIFKGIQMEGHYATEQNNSEASKLERKRPGKPIASKIKVDSLELTWTRPEAFTDKDFYQVRYKDPNTKWTFLHHEYSTRTINVPDLKANTDFVFQVRMVQDYEEGPYSEPSDTITTLQSLGGRLQGFSHIVEQGNPTKYALPLTELKYARCVEAKSRKFEMGSPTQNVQKEKTIMLVGATGTGKSTLVDGLVNYILGVNWNDPYRYTTIRLENEDQQRSDNQALSQTEWITCYVINPDKGSKLDYRLTIIDTPGFGGTRGMQRDNQIVDQIRELFSPRRHKGLSVIDAVCFLIKGLDAKLSATQKYVFHAIMSLFGQDLEENICSMITFADAQEPPVIAALQQADLPFGKFFTFNNSGLFSKNIQLNKSSLSHMFWEMGVKSYRAFFDNLSTMQTKSLSLTKQVLDERQKLELTISSLQPQVDTGLSKVQDLKRELQIIEQLQKDIKDNKDFEFDVIETHQTKKDLPRGQYVMNCLICNMTCHKRCDIARNDDKKRCDAMGSDGNCTICACHCHWTQHKSTPYIVEYVTTKVTRTYKEKQKKYQDASGQLLNAEQVLEKMLEELEELEEEIPLLMEEVNKSNNRLKEIALRPNTSSMVEHIDLMIESEKNEKTAGFQERIKALMEYKKRAEIKSDVERFTKEVACSRSTCPGRQQNTTKKKNKFNLSAYLRKVNPY